MGVFNAYEILKYLSHEQKMVKGKESLRTFKEQKKREKIFMLSTWHFWVSGLILLCARS